MSWNVTKSDVPKELVAQEVRAAHEGQSAYQHVPHRKIMDALTECAAAAAAVAPDGARVNVTSYGYFNDNGTGNFNLAVTQALP